jgi:hypothetical protein
MDKPGQTYYCPGKVYLGEMEKKISRLEATEIRNVRSTVKKMNPPPYIIIFKCPFSFNSINKE